MSDGPVTARSFDDAPDKSGERSVYALLEEARLRCEGLAAEARTESERASLRVIHNELGMAGLLASSGLEPDQRLALLAVAHQQSMRPILHTADAAHALAGTAISAEDVIGQDLMTAGLSDHMHLAHLHLLRAEELLAAHLQ